MSKSISGTVTPGQPMTEIVAKCESCGQAFVAVFHNPPNPCFKCGGKVGFIGRFIEIAAASDAELGGSGR
jgi:hypothetical protein